jgi:hypothetical protein
MPRQNIPTPNPAQEITAPTAVVVAGKPKSWRDELPILIDGPVVRS